ncbi:hypothetical protein EYV94_15025 [Puteibacter caeruleilacunae]|nr:hypothetical protein EYV94_15025 [Puteibacter caeruleilacunae]
MQRIILLLTLLLPYLAVKGQDNPVLKQFQKSKLLTSTIVPVKSDNLGEVVDLVVLDSVLVVTEMFTPQLYKLFDVKSGKLLKACISKGRGPNELQFPLVMTKNSGDSFSVFESSKNQLIYLSLKDLLSDHPHFTRKETVNNRSLKLYPLGNSQYVGTGIFEKGRFCLFDKKTNQSETFLEYPKEGAPSGTNNIALGMAYQASLSVHPNKDRFVVVCGSCPNMEICKIEQNKIISHKSTLFNTPIFKVQGNNVAFSSENLYAFNSLASSDKYIFTIYAGKSRKEHGSAFYSGRDLLVFDWNGNPIIDLKLDRDVYRMCFNEAENEIVAYSINAETAEPEIISYKLPSELK